MRKTAVARLTRVAAGGALTCLLAPFSIPLAGGVPLTLGTFAAVFLGLYLGPWEGTGSVALYLALGCMGLPVFSGARGGVGHLVGPTGGYLVGFLLLALFSGLFREKKWRVIGPLIGEIALYALGTAWFVFSTQTGLWQAFFACCLPFLPGDAVKAALALILYRLLRRRQDPMTKE